MRLASFAIFTIILLESRVADDYFLSEEEDQQINAEPTQENFMRQFTCLVAVQRYLSVRNDQISKLEQNALFNVNLKRVKGYLYNKCQEEAHQSLVDAVSAAKTQKDFEYLDWSMVESVDYTKLFANKETTLEEDEKKAYRDFLKVDERVREIQKKQQRENPNKEEGDDEETWDAVRKSKEPLSLAGLNLNSKSVLLAVGIAMAVLGLAVFKMVSSLLADQKKNKKKNKKDKSS